MYRGSDKIKGIYKGNSKVKKMYKGNVLVFNGKSANLLNEDLHKTIVSDDWRSDSGFIWLRAGVQLKPNTTYTISRANADVCDYRVRLYTDTTIYFIGSSAGVQNFQQKTFTTGDNGKLYIRFGTSGFYQNRLNAIWTVAQWMMLNEGSTALPYEPYEEE